MQLLVKNCRTIERDGLIDMAVDEGRIVKISNEIKEHADEVIDASGMLVIPSFIEPHVHLDKAFLAEKMPEASSMAEARRIVREAKKSFTKEDVIARAERCIRTAIQNGVLYIRSHVDVDVFAGTTSLEALLELKKKYHKLVKIQLVAFPQEGLYKYEGSIDILLKAVKMGADAVGGLPEAEQDELKGKEQIKELFRIANERALPIDLHCDVQPYTNYIEFYAEQAIKNSYFARATADHLIAMSYYDDSYAQKIIDLIKRSGMNVIANPCTSMVSGSSDPPPRGRGVTRIKEIVRSGINFSFGLDNIVDPYNPFGDFDPLRNAWLLAYEGQLNSGRDMLELFRMPTYNASHVLGLELYGLKEGNNADFNILPSKELREALRTSCRPTYVIKSGRVIARREEKHFILQ